MAAENKPTPEAIRDQLERILDRIVTGRGRQEDLDLLAAMGANYVNISHPGLFSEDAPYVLDQGIQANLDNLLSMLEDAKVRFEWEKNHGGSVRKRVKKLGHPEG